MSPSNPSRAPQCRRRGGAMRIAVAALLAASCQLLPGGSSSEDETAPAAAGPVAEGRQLLEQGQLDAALQKLQEAPNDPDSLYLQGRVWAAKAALAPPPEPLDDGGQAPEFKLEERNALAFFQTLLDAKPDYAAAYLAAAELLAPHALSRAKEGRRAAPPAAGDPDYSPERVKTLFVGAVEHGEGTEAVERMLAFCTELRDPQCVGDGFRHLIELSPESAEPRIRYGDYLMERDLVEEALRQYDIALVWAPDDEVTRGKLASIYLERGTRHLRAREWALADEALERAAEYVKDSRSEQARLLRERREELASRSGRR